MSRRATTVAHVVLERRNGQGDRCRPNGVIVVDKPRGPTSHDVVAHVRRTLGTREVGHAGTLDPMATGVLVLALGEATKLVPWLTAHDKTYAATILLGRGTDTLDADGREDTCAPLGSELLDALASSQPDAVAPLLENALAAERARDTQIPPAYSAIKTDGQRAFALARRGETPALAPREVRVHRLELVASRADMEARLGALDVELDVAKGYYVRALARDLAVALGTIGHLTALRRTRSGPFAIAETVAHGAAADVLLEHVCPLACAAAKALPVVRLTEAGVADARCGRVVRSADIEGHAPGLSAWLDARGELVAVGEADAEGHGRVVRGFVQSTT